MNNMAFGIAKVTEKGICFQDLYYSSAEAINGKWFEEAAIAGGWHAVVIYDPNKMNTIFFVNEKENNVIQCEVIQPQSEHGDILGKYFLSLQELKQRRPRKMKNRNPKNNFISHNLFYYSKLPVRKI